jgi:hypothetical protein
MREVRFFYGENNDVYLCQLSKQAKPLTTNTKEYNLGIREKKMSLVIKNYDGVVGLSGVSVGAFDTYLKERAEAKEELLAEAKVLEMVDRLKAFQLQGEKFFYVIFVNDDLFHQRMHRQFLGKLGLNQAEPASTEPVLSPEQVPIPDLSLAVNLDLYRQTHSASNGSVFDTAYEACPVGEKPTLMLSA